MAKLSTLFPALGVAGMLGLAGALTAPGHALAWGAAGHRMIGEAAMQGLPSTVPAFLRTPGAVLEVGELAREPDRRKGAFRAHDQNREPAHFVDLSDDGTILGGPKLSALPPLAEDYETALRAAGTTTWKAGALPYSIIDAEQQLARDFGTWRALNLILKVEKNPRRRAWLTADLARRERLIFSAIGELAHWVGDGSQPLHVSVHYNGWGAYPNPNGYTTAKIHAPFEGALVDSGVREGAVRAGMAPLKVPQGPLEARVAAYLSETGSQVEPLYALEKVGGIAPGDPRGLAFATARLSAGASALRDLIVEAWNVSPNFKVGWPAVSLSDIAAGKVDGYVSLYGKD